MNLKKLFLVNNECYKAGRKITPKGIMWHSTGANNPYLKRYVGPDDGLLGVNKYGNHWNQFRPDGRQVCVHAFIGKLQNGQVATYQTLPWNHRGWHAGGKANDGYIGFEICEDNLQDRNYFNQVYKEAIELTVYLCKLYGLTEKNIIDHSEGYRLGIASNHGDVKHWFSRHGKSMNMVRADVKKELGGGATVAVYKSGDKGAGVKQLQQDLIKLGFPVGRTGADGSFGPATREAIIAFQNHHKLVVDGIAGPATQAKVQELLKAPNKPTTNSGNGLYRVIVDKKQIGAYGEPKNVSKAVEEGITKGAKEILVQKV